MRRAHEIRKSAIARYKATGEPWEWAECMRKAWAEARESERLRSANFRQLLEVRGITLAEFVAAIDAGKRMSRKWEDYFWGRGECPNVAHFDFLERSARRWAA